MSIVQPQRETLRRQWTRVVVDLTNPEAIGLRMWRQDAIDRLVMAVGATEVTVGNPEFDARFVIQSRDDKIVSKVLSDAELQQLILRVEVDSVELLSRQLFVYYARSERDPEHAERLFIAATRLAEAIDAVKPDDKPEIIRT